MVTAADLAEQTAVFDEYREVVRMANRAGVVIVTGSDIAAERNPGFTLHEELALLVDAGLTADAGVAGGDNQLRDGDESIEGSRVD